MLYYDRIDLSKRIDPSNLNLLYALVVMICQCCLDISDTAIIIVKLLYYV